MAAPFSLPDRIARLGPCVRFCNSDTRYPILSIEDPMGQNDDAGLIAVTEQSGSKIQIIDDDYLVTNAAPVVERAQAGACHAVLVMVNQAGSANAENAVLNTANTRDCAAMISARSGETEDPMIVHLAVGWNARQWNMDALARSERIAKWNDLLRIEEAMSADNKFNRVAAFGPAVTVSLRP